MNILNPKETAKHSVAIYDNYKLALYSDIRQIAELNGGEDCLVDAGIWALVTEGHLSMSVEGEKYEMTKGCLFVCTPDHIIRQSMISMDFKAIVLCISPEYRMELINKAGLGWTSHVMTQLREVLHLDEKQMMYLHCFFDFLRSKILSDDAPHKSNCIDHLIMSLCYHLYDKSEERPDAIPGQTYSPAENLLQRFTMMLKENDPIHGTRKGYLSVNEYADLLHVTPKYFSTTCKRLTGRTAGQIIDDEIMKSAKILLHDNTKSIKQIAELLGFTNQSHFGTYFSRKTGISPQQFRKNGELQNTDM